MYHQVAVMRFDTSQHMRLSQQMKLAPRMIQSMEILQMPMLALQERIEQELESNVALEQSDVREDAPPTTSEDDGGDDRIGERELVVGDDQTGNAEDWERLREFESSYGDQIEYGSSRYREDGERDRKMDAMANLAARGESLTERLLHDWSLAEIPPDIARAGAVIIEAINRDGMLASDLATIAEQNRDVPGLELTPDLLDRALTEVQRRLDPPGIAARNPRECALLQIDALEANDEDLDHDWDTVRDLIEHHFEDLLENRLPRIVQSSGSISMAQIHDAMALMKRVTLSPGRDLVDEPVMPIIPDVIVEFDEELNEYTARLNGDVIPPLRISKKYKTMAADRAVDRETRDFVSKNVQSAQWLIESIGQRSNTLLRVVKVVLVRQRDWFDLGPQALKPLPMIDVADQLGIHVATVSRAVSDKWMQTPRGLVPLRRFFSGGTATASGKEMSWEAVKATLKEIIDAEDRTKPFSDEALAQELKKRGIDIARRTVVKYRQQLGIGSARKRKVFT